MRWHNHKEYELHLIVASSGKVFVGDPFQVDCEAANLLNLKASYLDMIDDALVEFDF